MKLIFATSNINKLKETRKMGFDVDCKNIELDEIQSIHTEQVAKHKAAQAYAKLRLPVIVEDTGLYINELNGFPGALVKWLAHGLGYEKICRLVDICGNRRAYAETCIAFCNGKTTKTFVGKVKGRIAMHPKGKRDFGWDYIFIPEGSTKTFAEMSMKEKNAISMRQIAFVKLRRFLSGKGLV